MKNLALTLLAVAASGCLDFTAAKFQCYDAGWCAREVGDPPSLISHSPANAAADVSVTEPLVLNFSRAMLPSSVKVELTPPDMLTEAQLDEEHLTAILVPSVPLRYATMYTVRVSGAAEDDGAPLPATSFTYTTRGAPDMSAPMLASSNPANGQMGAALSSKLILTFSEPMDPTSLRVASNPDFNWGKAVWTSMNQTATFSAPPAPLDPLTTYAVSVEATDVSGNSLTGSRTVVFTTTAAADTTKPTVVSVSPPAAATGISPATNISLSFSEPMQNTVVGAFSISPPVAGIACALDVAGVLLTCSHAGTPLAGPSTYTITLAGAASKDLAGNAMAADFTSTFMTSTTPDTTPPTVVSATPAAAAQGVDYQPAMQVTFSEPMDKAATQAALAVSSPASVTGTYSWDMSGKTVTFVPSAAFAQNTTVSWQVGTGAKDLSGNALATTQQYSFHVRRQVTLPALVSSNTDGYLYDVNGVRNASTTSAYLVVGDFSSNTAYRSYLYFDLSSIPQTALSIYEAKLSLHQTLVSTSSPYAVGGLGIVIGESITWATPLAASAWDAAPIPGICFNKFFCFPGPPTSFTVATNNSIGTFTSFITGFVQKALPSRKLEVQLRFSSKDTDNDGVGEYAYFDSADSTTAANRPTLNIIYEAP